MSLPSSRKRKRSSYESQGGNDRIALADEARSGMSPRPGSSIISNPLGEDEGKQVIVGPPIVHLDESGLHEDHSVAISPTLTHKKRKGKSGKSIVRQLTSLGDAASASLIADQGADVEAIDSNGEDMGLEDTVDAEADTAAKTEKGCEFLGCDFLRHSC